MTCLSKHTAVQVPDEEFNCPKCGRGPNPKDPQEEGLVVDNSAEGSDDSCPLLHDDDELSCYFCGWGSTGKRFATLYAKKKDLVTCPCCKGKGMVPSKKAKDGWTLIELMIAVAILGIIAAIIVPHLPGMEEYQRCCPCPAEAVP